MRKLWMVAAGAVVVAAVACAGGKKEPFRQITKRSMLGGSAEVGEMMRLQDGLDARLCRICLDGRLGQHGCRHEVQRNCGEARRGGIIPRFEYAVDGPVRR